MAKQTASGLTFSNTDMHTGISDNIDQMASADPTQRATARLNRDLVAVIDKWLADERSRGATPMDVLPSAMHGALTVCGTLLVNQPRAIRGQMFTLMRADLLKRFDAMGKAVLSKT